MDMSGFEVTTADYGNSSHEQKEPAARVSNGDSRDRSRRDIE